MALIIYNSAMLTRLLVFAVSATMLGQSPQIDSNLQQKLNDMVSLQKLFENPSPKLLKLTLTQGETFNRDGKKAKRYHLKVEGSPKQKSFQLMTWDIGVSAPVPAVQGIILDKDGVPRCPKTGMGCGEKDEEITISASGSPGQPRRFVIADERGAPVALGQVIPFPNTATDHGCTIEAIPLFPEGQAVLIRSRGFNPSESLEYLSSSYAEEIHRTVAANTKGEYITAVLPYVVGHDSGKTVEQISSAHCKLKITFDWGTYQEVPADSPAIH